MRKKFNWGKNHFDSHPRMQIFNSGGNLEEIELRSILVQPALLNDLVKQFPTLCQLENNEEEVFSVDDLNRNDNKQGRMTDNLRLPA